MLFENKKEPSSIRILIAEDNPVNMLLAKKVILRVTPESVIIEATNGNEALVACQTILPDLIFMDVQMPGMDGYEATQKIRALQQKVHIPIIAMTAGTLKGEKEKCLEAGMDDFLPKPFLVEALISLFEKWIGKKQKNEKTATLHSQKSTKAHVNIETLRTYVGDDDEALGEFLVLAISELEESCSVLLEKVEKKDLPALNKAGHKLYGTAVTAGAVELALFAKKMEHLTEFNPDLVADLMLQIQNEIVLVTSIINNIIQLKENGQPFE